MSCVIQCFMNRWVDGQVVRNQTAIINAKNMTDVFGRLSNIQRHLVANHNLWVGTTIECHILELGGRRQNRLKRHLVTLTKKH